ncbi:unnamed protein product [Clavelina lepadiformis]|uniref:Uncharacterized protein n=1 Tax=Clavelina lepadiformis TaxID=159417 RepID=A0ABP0FWT8_CLALP
MWKALLGFVLLAALSYQADAWAVRAREKVGCEVGPFGDWGDCYWAKDDFTGYGNHYVQVRYRNIIRGDERDCPSLYQVKECKPLVAFPPREVADTRRPPVVTKPRPTGDNKDDDRRPDSDSDDSDTSDSDTSDSDTSDGDSSDSDSDRSRSRSGSRSRSRSGSRSRSRSGSRKRSKSRSKSRSRSRSRSRSSRRGSRSRSRSGSRSPSRSGSRSPSRGQDGYHHYWR